MATASSSFGKPVGNERFNAEAAGWDSNPFVHEATNAAYKALKKTVPVLSQGGSSTDVLEIGCGTGILSLQIAKDVHQIVAVDAASGMIDVLKSKLQKPGAPTNVKPISVLLEDPEDSSMPPARDNEPAGPRLKYDLILSHLVLHHIAELKPVLTTMLGCLKPGGKVALTDFEDFGPEAKKFHPKSKLEGVERHGINQQWIRDLMKDVGFVDVNVQVGWTIPKEVEKFEGEFGDKAMGGEGMGDMMDFPFLICMGRKA